MKKTQFVLLAAGLVATLSFSAQAQESTSYSSQTNQANDIQVINRPSNTTNYDIDREDLVRSNENTTVTAGSIAKKEMDQRAQNHMGDTRATSTNNLGIGLDMGNRGQR